MASVVLVACGSRGDNEPILALATALLTSERFTAVHLCLTSDYQDLVPHDDRFHIHEVETFNIKDFKAAIDSYMGNADLAHANPMRIFAESLGVLNKRCITPALSSLLRLVKDVGPAAIVGTTLAMLIVTTVAQFTGVPGFVLHMQPNTPVASYPCYLSSFDGATQAATILANAVNKGTNPCFPQETNHEATYDVLFHFFTPALPDLNALRAELHLPPLSDTDVSAILKGCDSSVIMVHTYSTPLIPRVPELSPAVRVVRPLADDYVPVGWRAEKSCPKLSAYLDQGPPPVCINIGSLSVSSDALKRVTSALLRGLRSANVQRVLLLVGSSMSTVRLSYLSNEDDGSDASLIRWCNEHVFECVEDAQFSWLFSHCVAVVSHGGAGSVAAALRSGIPIVVAPSLCDQFFWSELITQTHLGAAVRPSLANCSSEAVCDAIRTVLSPKIVKNAATFGQQERDARSGANEMVRILEEKMN